MNLLSRFLLGVTLSGVVAPFLSAAALAAEARPNIVFSLAAERACAGGFEFAEGLFF